MPRRIRYCVQCSAKFIATSQHLSCQSCSLHNADINTVKPNENSHHPIDKQGKPNPHPFPLPGRSSPAARKENKVSNTNHLVVAQNHIASEIGTVSTIANVREHSELCNTSSTLVISEQTPSVASIRQDAETRSPFVLPSRPPVVSLLEDDPSDNEENTKEENDAASEAGDDFHCTQLLFDDEDDISSDEEDEDLALKDLFAKKRLSLEIRPVTTKTGVADDHVRGKDEIPEDQPIIDLLSVENDARDVVDMGVGSSEAEIVLHGASLTVDEASNNNENLLVCPTCGASLAHIKTWKGRVNHVKRCSKQHGVSANEIRTRLIEEAEWNGCEEENGRKSNNSAFAINALHHNQSLPSGMNPSPKPCNPYRQPSTSHEQEGGVKDSATTKTRDPVKLGPPSALDTLMAGARKMAQGARTKRKLSEEQAQEQPPLAIGGMFRKPSYRRQRQYNAAANAETSTVAPRRGCPAYKKITGTDFVVDGFYYAKPSLTQNYFLTHFHSDHYGGITRHWNAGTIYCSKTTANLVHSQLGVDWQYLHTLPMNKPVPMKTHWGSTATVTLIDANHCPGAVMMLFKVGSRHILHVGDFRWRRDVMVTPTDSPLRPFCAAGGTQRLDELFLDTTYCNPKYALPSQQDAIQAAVQYAERQLKEAQSMKQDILLLFGAYTIGKERIYLAVAERLKMKVYVDRRRYRILSQFDWPPERMALITTSPQDSILWVVPLGHVSMKKLPSYTSVQIGKSFSRDFARVVGFRPTGWSLTSKPQKYKDGSTTNLIKATTRGKVSSCGVPYSEHSSFPELVDCINSLNPRKIVPTVSVSKSKEQIDLLLSHVAR